MASTTNGRAIFNKVPTDYPVVGETIVYDDSEKIDLNEQQLDGGILVKTLVLSIDPYLRGRMRAPAKQSYNLAFTLGQPIASHGVGVILRSECPQFKTGDHIYGLFPHVNYFVQTKNLDHFRLLQNTKGINWRAYVGVCGMPGQTAYMGWKAYARAKRGETVFVTTGAGPVGSLVIQLAKQDGLKVIASAGSDEKVAFMKSIGADVAFNYKTTSTADILNEHGPINIYWDHVGGESLDLALGAAAQHARFIECGMISTYNEPKPYIFKNLMTIIGKSITVQGFIVSNLLTQYGEEFYREIPPKVASGEIKFSEDIRHGLESVGQAIVDVQRGNNTGKTVIVVADE